MARAELVAEYAAIVPGQPFDVALRIVMEKDVHTYWRNPGDSGMPTTLDWRLPPGFEAGPLQWPLPVKFFFEGFASFGYSGELLLPVRIEAPASLRPGMSIRLTARADWLGCTDICVPEGADLSLILPVRESPGDPTPWAASFEQTRRRLPRDAEGWRLGMTPSEGRHVTLRVQPPDGVSLEGTPLYFYPYDGGLIEAGGEQVATHQGGAVAMRLPVSTFRMTPVDALKGILVVGEGQADAFALEVAVNAAR